MPLQANHGNREGFAHIVVINQRSDCGRISCYAQQQAATFYGPQHDMYCYTQQTNERYS